MDNGINQLLDEMLQKQHDAAIWAEQGQYDSEGYCLRRIRELRASITEHMADRDALLAAACRTRTLWDIHGMGDDDGESEPVYKQLCEAIQQVERR